MAGYRVNVSSLNVLAVETVVPGKPTYVRTRTFPDSVFVMWRPPDTEDILIRGYIVGYGEGVPDVNWQYVDALRRNVTIKNLSKSYLLLLPLANMQ